MTIEEYQAQVLSVAARQQREARTVYGGDLFSAGHAWRPSWDANGDLIDTRCKWCDLGRWDEGFADPCPSKV